MAEESKSPAGNSVPDVVAMASLEEAAARVRKLNDDIIESASASGQRVLDTYEKTLRAMLDAQLAAAEGTQIQWVNTMARGQAQFLLEVSTYYTKAARDMLG